MSAIIFYERDLLSTTQIDSSHNCYTKPTTFMTFERPDKFSVAYTDD